MPLSYYMHVIAVNQLVYVHLNVSNIPCTKWMVTIVFATHKSCRLSMDSVLTRIKIIKNVKGSE